MRERNRSPYFSMAAAMRGRSVASMPMPTMVIALLYNACRFPETMASAIPSVLPTLPREFIWTDQPWGAVLQCVPLAAVAVHGWTTRQLAITGGPGSCDAQWQQLAQAGAVAR